MSREHRVDGHVFLEYGLPAKGAAIRLYAIGCDGTVGRLGEEKTDEQGHFEMSYVPYGKLANNIEARIVEVQGKKISISGPKVNPNKGRIS